MMSSAVTLSREPFPPATGPPPRAKAVIRHIVTFLCFVVFSRDVDSVSREFCHPKRLVSHFHLLLCQIFGAAVHLGQYSAKWYATARHVRFPLGCDV